jgi:hypothetical protein
VDAFIHSQLVEAISGHDVCASALGPFHLFECRCAKAAIEAHVDYCSVCDDWNAAADVIDNYHVEAQRQRVTCITGFGATPGISNMIVSMLASTMDFPTEVQISCYQPLNAGGGEAVLRHMLFVMSGLIPVVRDGVRRNVKACSESARCAFSKVGEQTVWNMGHAEPATMYRYFPSLRRVEFRMGFGFGSRLLVWPAYLGLFNFRIFVWLVIKIFTALEYILRRFPKGLGSLRIDVFGMRDGSTCHEQCHGIGEMREVTGVSLAIGARLLALKQTKVVSIGGVYAPEGAMTMKFLLACFHKGFVGTKDIAQTQPYSEEDIIAAAERENAGPAI